MRAARLGLGTVQFGLPYGVSNAGGQVSSDEAGRILARAEEAGLRLLDTAAAYGSAEEVLGQLLAPDAPFRIVTKTQPLKAGLTAAEARARRSVELIGRPPLDTLMVHAAGDLAGPEGDALWAMMGRLRDEGLFARIGISAYVADDPMALAERFRPAVMQIPVSLLDQRLVQDGTLRRLKALGVEVHVRSVFLQGLVLMDPDALPPRLAHAAQDLRAVRGRITASEATPVEAALAFALAQPEIDAVIVGVTRTAELDEIVAAAERPEPAIDWPACALDDPVVLTPSLW